MDARERTDRIEELNDELRRHYYETAKKIWPRGTVLNCPTCQKTIEVSVGEIATFLADGWPTCHGTMHAGDLPEIFRIAG